MGLDQPFRKSLCKARTEASFQVDSEMAVNREASREPRPSQLAERASRLRFTGKSFQCGAGSTTEMPRGPRARKENINSLDAVALAVASAKSNLSF